MGVFQINKIKSDIIDIYTDKIDLKDCKGRDEQYIKNVFLTRALNAFVINKICGESPEEIAKCICDGYDDNGIDCIYYCEDEKTLYLSQSKWSHEGDKSPELGDIDKFIKGVRDLISCRFDNFNKKVKDRSEEIEKILYKTKKLNVTILLTHTSTQTSEHINKRFEEFLQELNDTSDSFSFLNVDQKMLFNFIQGEGLDKIDLEEVVLKEWGKKSVPKKAYYGCVDGSQVAKWFSVFGTKLFSKNIRMIIPDSEINSEIKDTIIKDPDSFWYYNNGITLIAEKIEKRTINAEERDFAIFDCENVSIINGAQTVGTIGKYFLEYKNDEEKLKALEKVNIQIRLIDINENTETDTFSDKVTKANNRQNKVENRDFISLETNQKRIVSELRVMGITYNIVRSDDVICNELNFDVSESTRALSNALNIEASTLIHREPGKVWSDIKHQRYRQLFNSGVRGIYVWNVVKIQRVIDKRIEFLKEGLKGEQKSLLTYGQDVISCIIFNKIKDSVQNEIIMEDDSIELFNINKIMAYSIEILKAEVKRISKGIPTIFKNFTHCDEIFMKSISEEEYKNLNKFNNV